MKSRITNGLLGTRRNEQFAQRLAKIESGPQSATAPQQHESAESSPQGADKFSSSRHVEQKQPTADQNAQQPRPPEQSHRSSPQTNAAQPKPSQLQSPTVKQAGPAAAGTLPGSSVAKEDPIDQVKGVARAALKPVLLFSVIINLLMLTGPLFMLQVYDRALPSGNLATLAILFVLVSILYLFFALLDGVRSRIFIRLGTRIDEILHQPVYRALLRLSGHDPTGGGPQPLRDLDSVRSYVSGTGPAAFFDIPWVPVYLGLIFFMHPVLGVFSIIAAAILVTVAILNKRLTQQGHGEVARATFDAHRFAEEGRRDASVAQALGMQPSLVEEWTRRKGEAIGLMGRIADRSGLFMSASKSLRLFFQSAMLGLGAWLAIEQLITAGMIIAATIIMSRALAPIEQTIQQWPSYVGAVQAWERLQELFEKMPAEPARRTALPAPTGSIQASNLACFAPGAARPVISGIDFELDPGAGLGVIGPSGVGKSTLVKAILGIWPKISGDVRLDGAEHGQWNPAVLGRYLGYLPQQATLLPGTVAQNIARFDPDADSASILNAARITGAHQLAVSLPDGYDTIVGADGVQLSSGQVQRIALARAVYGMPPIVVLDEPYSNLDSDGEHALTETIRAMREFGSTVVVVTHRSSALNALDTILCLRAGRQAFYGPKDDVLRAMTQAVAGQGSEGVAPKIDDAAKPRQIEAQPATPRAKRADKPVRTGEAAVVAMRPNSSQQPADGTVRHVVSSPAKVAPQPGGPPPTRPIIRSGDESGQGVTDATRSPVDPKTGDEIVRDDETAAREKDKERLAMIRRKQAELQAKMARQPMPTKAPEGKVPTAGVVGRKVAHG